MKNTKLFITLLSLDLLTKTLALVIQPSNSWFYLTYNPNMVFNLDFGVFVKFALPLMILPLFLAMGFYLNKNQRSVYFPMVAASFLGNYIGRFTSTGVIDFIQVGNLNANVADLIGWGSYIYFIGCVIQPLVEKVKVMAKK